MRALALATTTTILLVLAPSAAGGPTCTVRAEEAVPILDDHYLVHHRQGTAVTIQLWLETNGVPGLQTQTTRCAAGDVWRPDTLRLNVPIAPFGGLPI